MKKFILLLIGVFIVGFIFLNKSGGTTHNTFTKKTDGVYIFHYQLYGDQKFLLEGIDSGSFESLSKHYFKDKNGSYIIDGYKGKYKKINADVATFEKYQDYYMQDKNCIFLFGKCINKGVDSDITMNIDKNDDKKLLINYNGKKIINNLNIGMGNGSGGSTVINSTSDSNHKPGLDYYENLVYSKSGTYNIIVILEYIDGTFSYNTKEVNFEL